MIEGQIETITGDEMIRQPTQSISGIDGRPLTDCDGQCGGCTSHRPDELDADGESGRCADGDQDDPVLNAIDGEHWDFLVNPQTDLPDHNRSIRRIRTAYLDFKVAHDSWIERANRALESRKPSDGGEFERKLKKLRYMPESAKQILSDAHNADRAADKQRIAELEAAHENYKSMIRDRDKRISELTGELNVSRVANESLRERIARLEADNEKLGKTSLSVQFAFLKDMETDRRNRIAELEEQNLNMMALFRDFYELEFNRDECWEIIKKYGGDA